jgi:hypothetical protein
MNLRGMTTGYGLGGLAGLMVCPNDKKVKACESK